MRAFLYGAALQWRLDIRSRSLLITCYVVPLLFFAIMGGIFTSLDPQAGRTLIPSMTVMGVSMGAFIGAPPSLTEIYGGEIKKMYQANGVPLYLGVVSVFLSALVHLTIMSAIICAAAPIAFGAAVPADLPAYFAGLMLFTAASLGVGCALGLAVKSQSKLTMLAQLLFLPSIMLSGIMFPAELLPGALQGAGRLFPAAWGYRLMQDGGLVLAHLWPLAAVLAGGAGACALLLKRLRAAG